MKSKLSLTLQFLTISTLLLCAIAETHYFFRHKATGFYMSVNAAQDYRYGSQYPTPWAVHRSSLYTLDKVVNLYYRARVSGEYIIDIHYGGYVTFRESGEVYHVS